MPLAAREGGEERAAMPPPPRSRPRCFGILPCADGPATADDNGDGEGNETKPHKSRHFLWRRSTKQQVLNRSATSESVSVSYHKEKNEDPSSRLSPPKRTPAAEKPVEEETDGTKPLPSSEVGTEGSNLPVINWNGIPIEDAAIVIQASFRGHLARKEVAKLRNIVKMQAAIRGRLVRKQTIGTLRCVLAIIRIQATVRARHARRSVTKLVVQDDAASLLEESPCIEQKRVSSSSQILLSNGFASQIMETMTTTKKIEIKCDPSESDSAWRWLERWTAANTKQSQEELNCNYQVQDESTELSDKKALCDIPLEDVTLSPSQNSGAAESQALASEPHMDDVNYATGLADSGSKNFSFLEFDSPINSENQGIELEQANDDNPLDLHCAIVNDSFSLEANQVQNLVGDYSESVLPTQNTDSHDKSESQGGELEHVSDDNPVDLHSAIVGDSFSSEVTQAQTLEGSYSESALPTQNTGAMESQALAPEQCKENMNHATGIAGSESTNFSSLELDSIDKSVNQDGQNEHVNDGNPVHVHSGIVSDAFTLEVNQVQKQDGSYREEVLPTQNSEALESQSLAPELYTDTVNFDTGVVDSESKDFTFLVPDLPDKFENQGEELEHVNDNNPVDVQSGIVNDSFSSEVHQVQELEGSYSEGVLPTQNSEASESHEDSMNYDTGVADSESKNFSSSLELDTPDKSENQDGQLEHVNVDNPVDVHSGILNDSFNSEDHQVQKVKDPYSEAVLPTQNSGTSESQDLSLELYAESVNAGVVDLESKNISSSLLDPPDKSESQGEELGHVNDDNPVGMHYGIVNDSFSLEAHQAQKLERSYSEGFLPTQKSGGLEFQDLAPALYTDSMNYDIVVADSESKDLFSLAVHSPDKSENKGEELEHLNIDNPVNLLSGIVNDSFSLEAYWIQKQEEVDKNLDNFIDETNAMQIDQQPMDETTVTIQPQLENPMFRQTSISPDESARNHITATELQESPSSPISINSKKARKDSTMSPRKRKSQEVDGKSDNYIDVANAMQVDQQPMDETIVNIQPQLESPVFKQSNASRKESAGSHTTVTKLHKSPSLKQKYQAGSKRAPSNANNDSGGRKSRRKSAENSPNDQKNERRPRLVGLAKPVHVEHDPKMNNSSHLPSYMQPTEATRAKTNPRPLSKSSLHRRDSFPVQNVKQAPLPRIQNLSSEVQQGSKGRNDNLPRSLTERRWRASF